MSDQQVNFNALIGDLAVEYVPIDSIQPNAYNPNVQSEHEFDLLCQSMRSDGFTQPIIVQRNGRTIVDGEHRWRAGRSVGFSEVPVVFVEMTPEQMRISTLRHNRARGTEDAQLASAVLRDLSETVDLNALADELSVSAEDLALELDIDPPGITAEDLVPGLDTAKDNGIPADVADLLRKKEAEISTAMAEKETQARQVESTYYFVSLTYTTEEGKVIEAALNHADPNSKPAALLAMVRKALVEQW